MSQNILITGAAGFIGGTVLANFIGLTEGPIAGTNIFAAVRSEEQIKKLSKLSVNLIQLDLNDEQAVKEAILGNKIDIIVHTAGAVDPRPISNLVKGLGDRRKIKGQDTYFIHTSVATIFTEEGGWPAGEVKDTDDLFEKEKEIGGPNHVRLTNILLMDQAETLGVTAFNIPVPVVYGRGTGEGRKLSVNIPAFVRASMKHKIVYKFDKDGKPPGVHVSDLADLYRLLTEKILSKEPIPSGRKGYYFATVHQLSWWEVMDRIAQAMYARGLVNEPTVQIWPNEDMAAESCGFPRLYLRAIGTSSGEHVPVNAYKLGWQPKWTREKFMESIDDEVQDVLELDRVKASLFDDILSS
ncbi:nad dependent epimerase dehydratase family protein [Colletotrichum truncatum]|uniref:Nad dependent epimerase dehydratase family protein n=1 Tax=Colletotrichum truncatum TaxID=5467 RepID=A0ACC3ZBQ7_COLTU|nr:nad dependent epimerase dehydratase family protein [Colletotrichum truncatum]KAF6783780.1 nad dependent epimerase dehydratase family protein [Colletotrichum truncatum]